MIHAQLNVLQSAIEKFEDGMARQEAAEIQSGAQVAEATVKVEPKEEHAIPETETSLGGLVLPCQAGLVS